LRWNAGVPISHPVEPESPAAAEDDPAPTA
jgi:hypothetical protein